MSGNSHSHANRDLCSSSLDFAPLFGEFFKPPFRFWLNSYAHVAAFATLDPYPRRTGKY